MTRIICKIDLTRDARPLLPEKKNWLGKYRGMNRNRKSRSRYYDTIQYIEEFWLRSYYFLPGSTLIWGWKCNHYPQISLSGFPKHHNIWELGCTYYKDMAPYHGQEKRWVTCHTNLTKKKLWLSKMLRPWLNKSLRLLHLNHLIKERLFNPYIQSLNEDNKKWTHCHDMMTRTC